MKNNGQKTMKLNTITTLMMTLLIALTLGFGTPAANAQCETASFESAGSYDVGNAPVSVTTGDFNNDGILDLATANLILPNGIISVLLGNGDGTFGAAQNFAVGNNPALITTGNFDGNGSLDLAVANGNSNDVSILLNTCPAFLLPMDKDQCKNGGWMNFTFPRTFKNQGDCIKFVNTGK